MSHIFFNRNASLLRLCVALLIFLVTCTSSPIFVMGADEGESGTPGSEGAVGDPGSEGGAPPVESVPVFSENDLVDATTTPSGDDGVDAVTGGQSTSSPADISIETGDASAGGLISTDVNSNEIQSLLSTTTPESDLDTYILNATGTNDAIVSNTGTTSAVTGDNLAESAGTVFIETGDAVSVLNIANIVNTNVINSNGFIYLLNQLLDGVLSLDLRNLFFPDEASLLAAVNSCSLLSCAAEDVTYNVLQTNTATITNDGVIDAISGRNEGVGDVVTITTGDSYAAANVINVANTNIIDSNYRLMAVNGIGTLDGDLVLPSEALFRAFFGLPNGMNQVENAESVVLIDTNENNAVVNNNLDTNAETGSNDATTTYDGITTTGTGYAESNVLNQVNQNLFGGDSLYMMIRVHGSWNGNVFGLPEGLTWIEVPEGIVIYSADAEIVPSEILQYDIDSYQANFTNKNDIVIDNNLTINAISGENALEGDLGLTQTGDSYAGANVMNVANTNVVGRNWIMAIMNIFGDFNGNVSFGRPDLWVGGQVQAAAPLVGPGTKLVYTYTIKNNGDLKASDIELTHRFTAAHMRYSGAAGEPLSANDRREVVGTLLPGETRVVSFDAYVDEDIPVGTTTVRVDASLKLRESDNNKVDNRESLALDALRSQVVVPPVPVVVTGGSSSGGGGGGRKSPKGKVLGKTVEVIKSKINPKSAPKITVKKTANTTKNNVIKAGQEVAYTVVVTNGGGTAYGAQVVDRLINPIGAVMSEQSWDLGTIGAGEKVTLEYTVEYDSTTPSGPYTNTASVIAYLKPNDLKKRVRVSDAVHTLEVTGQPLAIGNVGATLFVPTGAGLSAAIIAWETIKPADSQVYFGIQPVGTSTSPAVLNYGYERSSYHSPLMTTQHYIVLAGLINGATYNYRLRSKNLENEVLSHEYAFVVPGGVLPFAVATTSSVTF